MDPARCDDSLHSIGSVPSRRGLLRLLGTGTVAAALLGRLASGDAAASKKQRRKKKRKRERGGTTCKAADETCVSAGECCGGTCANLPSSGVAVCRRQMCAAANEACQTHGDCCSGGCFENANVCFD